MREHEHTPLTDQEKAACHRGDALAVHVARCGEPWHISRIDTTFYDGEVRATRYEFECGRAVAIPDAPSVIAKARDLRERLARRWARAQRNASSDDWKARARSGNQMAHVLREAERAGISFDTLTVEARRLGLI
jgi:hypothetical protein